MKNHYLYFLGVLLLCFVSLHSPYIGYAKTVLTEDYFDQLMEEWKQVREEKYCYETYIITNFRFVPT